MAWTNPVTKLAGNTGLSSDWNTYVRDNTNALRDYLLGAQDLGSNWKISSGRSLGLDDATNVAHGMTTIAATSTYGLFEKKSSTDGGLQLTGLSDTASTSGLIVRGIVGNASPSVAGLVLQGSKKSGTGAQGFASSEAAIQFNNDATALASFYSAGLTILGSLTVGFSGAPTQAGVFVADNSFGLQNVSANYALYFNGINTAIYGTRGVLATEAMTFTVFGITMAVFKTAGLQLYGSGALTLTINGLLQFNYANTALGGGAAPTLGTIGGGGPATAAQNAWIKCQDSTGAVIYIPIWK